MELKNFLILYAVSYAIATPIDTNSTQLGEDGKQSKRELSEVSYSYAATDIGSKGGTRIKTITILKNFKDSEKEKTLKINPELHKKEDWGSKFRDNFDSFGKIPDVPEIENFALIKEEPKKQDFRQEIPIYEISKSEEEEDKIVPDKEELNEREKGKDETEENQNQDQNEGIMDKVHKGEAAHSNSKELPEDVELFEPDSQKEKMDKNGPKSQPLIAASSLKIDKQQKQSLLIKSPLNTQPYHLVQAKNAKSINQKQSSEFNPYKLSDLYKLPYSPLLFPPIPPIPTVNSNENPILSEISSTTPHLTKGQLATTSTQRPYRAPYKFRNTSSSPLPNKTRNFGGRSRGLKYK